MAINKIDWPTSGVPDVTVDYPRQNNNLQAVVRGYNAVTLTNWDDSTTAPQVSSGSVIECNGVLYEADANYTITAPGSNGTYFLLFNDSSEIYSWSSTAPTWDDGLNGWYIGTYRFTGHVCLFSTPSTYTAKREYGQGQGGATKITPIGRAEVSDISITCTVAEGEKNENLPQGLVQLGYMTISASGTSADQLTANVQLRVRSSVGLWYAVTIYEEIFTIGSTPSRRYHYNVGQYVSNGTDYRLYLVVTNVSGSTSNSITVTQEQIGYFAT